MSEPIIEHIGDDLDVTVRYEVEGASVKFFAAEVTGEEPTEGVKYYWRKGATSSNDDTTDFSDAERYVDGFVKWDGCSHFYFGDENGYLHLCGKSEIDKLAAVVQAIHRRCRELMNKLDEDF